MNLFNALGFLALGSLMNALPALAPSLVDRGGIVIGDLTPSALWLHFMGLVVGMIGGSTLMREALAARSATRARVPARPVAVPQPARVPQGAAAQAA